MAARRRAAAPGEPPAAGAPAGVVDLARHLGTVLADLGLSEIEVAWGDVRVRLQRAAGGPPAPAAAGPLADAARPLVADAIATTAVTVEAPMVGTFYRAASPGAEPYVNEGDAVKEGQILCIIEAMKLMNEIEAKVAGRIVKILVDNAQPVEYGQPLFLIDPQR
jgi:acetyl-CoA carboxylase biotin carboxyl carrier protein